AERGAQGEVPVGDRQSRPDQDEGVEPGVGAGEHPLAQERVDHQVGRRDPREGEHRRYEDGRRVACRAVTRERAGNRASGDEEPEPEAAPAPRRPQVVANGPKACHRPTSLLSLAPSLTGGAYVPPAQVHWCRGGATRPLSHQTNPSLRALI